MAHLAGDRGFESRLLQRRVSCEPDFRGRIHRWCSSFPLNVSGRPPAAIGCDPISSPRSNACDDNLLRQVIYEGLRGDKPASEVRRPVPHPKPLAEEGSVWSTSWILPRPRSEAPPNAHQGIADAAGAGQFPSLARTQSR
jgi:hypothetical protein